MNSLRRSSINAPKPHPSSGPPGSGILKVAVQTEGQQPLLYELDQKQPLLNIVRDVCSKWSLANPDKYCLQHSDTKEFITEKTRHQLKNGALLRVAELPKRTVTDICNALLSRDPQEMARTLSTLPQTIAEEERVQEFVSKSGLKILVTQILTYHEKLEDSLAGPIAFARKLLETNRLWEVASEPFIILLLRFANASPYCSEAAFTFLTSGIRNASPLFLEAVLMNVSIKGITAVFGSHPASIDTKVAALRFLNTLLSKSELTKRFELLQEVHKKYMPELIYKNIITKTGITDELAFQLTTFQTLYLSLVGKKLHSPYDREDKSHQSLLLSFMMACQASMGRIRPVGISSLSSPSAVSVEFPDVDTSRMGLMKSEPSDEFQEVPGGLLALECLSHFTMNWSEECDQHFVSNLSRTSSQQCPFVRGGFAVVRIVADILGVMRKSPGPDSHFLKIFFSTRSCFEDVFSLAMQVFNKTWREMGALTVDVDKVATVVKKHVSLVLMTNNADWTAFKAGLWEMNYTKISSVIEDEKSRVDDTTSQSAPAKELSARISPEIMELVKTQRLNTLVAGDFFPNWKEKEKGRQKSTVCCRLHSNRMVLHWAECELTNVTPVPYEQLTNKIQISEVRELVIGKDCPHVKSSSKKPGTWSNFAFALMYNNDDHIGFLVEDERTFASWVDGLRVLLKQPMNEPSSLADIEMMLEMELKVRLLNVENIKLPDQPPKIPPEPADFEFYYQAEEDFPP
ncbi:engulfment and cell motility protein 1-like [Sycon ciliatum]|uniref:engulfment and cell motility protein 1-like n=1 Tax=Sycon ciliatum TaxID=27933 RepID=UPI0020AA6AE6|eukprot:scpid49467/ scgid35064/ Engulfment and cell motility protein 1; Protein ced-12 homolog